jgi:hypothetical protein
MILGLRVEVYGLRPDRKPRTSALGRGHDVNASLVEIENLDVGTVESGGGEVSAAFSRLHKQAPGKSNLI